MGKSRKIKKHVMITAIVLLSVTLIIVIVIGERYKKKNEDRIYEGCKSVLIIPEGDVV